MATPELTIDLNISCRQNLLNLIIESNPKLKDITLNNVNISDYGENTNNSIEGDFWVEITGIPTRGYSGKHRFYYNRVSLKNWQIPDIVGEWAKRKNIVELVPSIAGNTGPYSSLKDPYYSNNQKLLVSFKDKLLGLLGLHKELPLFTPWYLPDSKNTYIYKCNPWDKWLINNVRLAKNIYTDDKNRPIATKLNYTPEELNAIVTTLDYPNQFNTTSSSAEFFNIMFNLEYYPFLLYKDYLWFFGKV